MKSDFNFVSSTFSAAKRKPSSPFLHVSIRLFKSETASGDLPEEELPDDKLLLDEELPNDEEPLFDEELPLLIEPKLLPGVELMLPGVEPGRLLFGEDILLEPLGVLLLEELPHEEPLGVELDEEPNDDKLLPGIEEEPEVLLPDDKLLPGVEVDEPPQALSDDFDESESDGSGFDDKPLFEEFPVVESPLTLFVLRLELIFPAWLVLTCPS